MLCCGQRCLQFGIDIKRIDTGKKMNEMNEYIDSQLIDFILPRNKVDLS